MIRLGEYIISKHCIQFIHMNDKRVIITLLSGEVIIIDRKNATDEQLEEIIRGNDYGLDIK